MKYTFDISLKGFYSSLLPEICIILRILFQICLPVIFYKILAEHHTHLADHWNRNDSYNDNENGSSPFARMTEI